ncbi:MAG: glycosyl hydrolase, partial [Bacteroidales bacterium]|nr:glycosyl hydrolase [Bacteroidales bacterium]
AILYDGECVNLYPPYSFTAEAIKDKAPVDFTSSSGSIRFTHRTLDVSDIYFVSNRTGESVTTDCSFRVSGMVPELWDPMDGKRRALPEFSESGGVTTVPLSFEPNEGYFVVFSKSGSGAESVAVNIPRIEEVATLPGPWEVSFDPMWGDPVKPVIFKELKDWSTDSDPAVRFYSGTAVYTTEFEVPAAAAKEGCLVDLGDVKVMARVSLNGEDLGIVWTTPWRVEACGALKDGKNVLKVEVVNLWQNRLVGDELKSYDGPQGGRWPQWLIEGNPRPSDRYTFTTWRHYGADTPLLPSGLLGPVRILSRSFE